MLSKIFHKLGSYYYSLLSGYSLGTSNKLLINLQHYINTKLLIVFLDVDSFYTKAARQDIKKIKLVSNLFKLDKNRGGYLLFISYESPAMCVDNLQILHQ